MTAADEDSDPGDRPSDAARAIPAPAWRFGEFADRPPLPAAPRRGVRFSLRSLLSRSSRESEEIEAQQLSPVRALHQVPDPDPNAAAVALEKALEGRARAFVLCPAAEAPGVLRAFAEVRDLEVMAEPEPGCAARRAASGDLLERLGDPAPLVVPDLGAYFLRHEECMSSLRELVTASLAHPAAVLGCGDWFWDFLDGVERVRTRAPLVLCPWPFDRDALVTALDLDSYEVIGDEDFGAWLGEAALGVESVARSLTRLALRDSQGRSGLALARPGELGVPAVPSGLGYGVEVVLDALLLHGGLPADALAELLAGHEHAHVPALAALAEAGVVVETEGVWAVGTAAYPAAVSYLAGHGWRSGWIR